MARVLVDTSAIYALLDRGDANHRAARKTLGGLKTSRTEPFLTNFIVAEAHALLLSRLSHDIARAWLVGNTWPIERVTSEDETRAKAIIVQYRDKAFSFTDAASFAVMERLSLKTAFAFDPHFRQYGFQVIGLPAR